MITGFRETATGDVHSLHFHWYAHGEVGSSLDASCVKGKFYPLSVLKEVRMVAKQVVESFV